MNRESRRQADAWSASRWSFLVRFALARMVDSDGAGPYELSLTLAEALTGGARIQATFTGVVGLEVGDLNGLLGWMLEIEPVADRGLERIRYRVVESENDSLRFWCHDYATTALGASGESR